MNIKTNHYKNIEEVEKELPFVSNNHTIIICFTTLQEKHKELYFLLEEKGYQPITIDSFGQFIKGSIIKSGITCMILELPLDSFRIKRFNFDRDYYELGYEAGKFAKKAFKDSSTLFFSSISFDTDVESIIDGFKESSNDIPIFGAIASNKTEREKNFIGIDGEVEFRTLGIVVFNSKKISLRGLAVNGWNSIGIEKEITKSIDNRVYEIDNKPIYDVYKDYFGFDKNTSISSFLEYPISLIKTNGSVVTRVIVDTKEDYIKFSGKIEKGSKIHFCSPNITKAVSDAINEINRFQCNNMTNSDAILAFSCKARYHSFSFYIQNEIQALNEMWGKKHIGFFSNGEIGQLDNYPIELHNNSLSIVFIEDLTKTKTKNTFEKTEYKEYEIKIDENIDKNEVIRKLQSEKQVLSSFQHKISNELNDFKNNLEIKVQNQVSDIYELNKEIIDTQKELLFTMGEMAESRSKETSDHVKRVTAYSELLAKKINLDKESIMLLNYASPMHDIGKIGIPDSILNKPGRLTFEEFEVMKTHTTLGYNTLKHSNKPILKAAAIIAHQHHERWDGKGYPNNLEKKNIHIFGRISAIADVFDALSFSRIYKEAWEDHKIFDLFKEERAKQFDPLLNDIFLDNFDEFIQIRNLYKK